MPNLAQTKRKGLAISHLDSFLSLGETIEEKGSTRKTNRGSGLVRSGGGEGRGPGGRLLAEMLADASHFFPRYKRIF